MRSSVRRMCRASTRPRGRGSAKPCAPSAMRRACATVSRSTGVGERTFARYLAYVDRRNITVGGTPMRVVVDFDLCESNALCMQAAPEVFEVRDDDFLYVLQENPPEELRAKVEEAGRRRPKQAIGLED